MLTLALRSVLCASSFFFFSISQPCMRDPEGWGGVDRISRGGSGYGNHCCCYIHHLGPAEALAIGLPWGGYQMFFLWVLTTWAMMLEPVRDRGLGLWGVRLLFRRCNCTYLSSTPLVEESDLCTYQETSSPRASGDDTHRHYAATLVIPLQTRTCRKPRL